MATDTLNAFLAENVETVANKKVVISKRFKDADGNPIEWELRPISSALNDELQRRATVQRNERGRVIRETDQVRYMGLFLAESVVYPDLNNAKLQDSYGVKSADALLKKMLLVGEMNTLAQEVSELSNLEGMSELVDEAKN